MFPTIHDFTANDLNTRGYGALSDCISCEVTEELNGAFTLELTYPLNGLHAEYLVTGNIIVAKPNYSQATQPFRISEVKKSFANNIQVYANHICYDLSGYPIRSAYTLTSLASVITTLNNFTWSTGYAVYHPFTFGTDIQSMESFSMPAMQTVRSWMGGQDGSILNVYGGEWTYNNFSCTLISRRGQDTGYRISYGKNLAEYEKDKNYTEYSHACAYWKKSDVVVYSDLIPTSLNCPFRCGYIDATKAFDSQPSVAQLNSYASGQISSLVMGGATITVTPAQLGNDVISLGDSVLICYETVFSTRVVKTVWDVLGGVYKSLQLGTKKVNITDTIKSLTTGPNGDSGSDSEVYMNTATMGLRKTGSIAELRFYGKASGEVNSFTLPLGYRPSNNLSFPIVVGYNSNFYQGYLVVGSNGGLTARYYNYGTSESTPVSNAVIYGTHTYFLG